ncbi:NADH oxidase [Aphelenchoides bicaudatus]|nr:NADH oxidase [Aphelenchoides bicaudatus]
MSRVRVPASRNVDVSILGEQLVFPTSKRVAPNRFLKAAMTERISTYIHGEPLKSGIPVQKLLNLYEKWSHGGFGMLLSGNIPVDFYHLESAGNVFIDERFETPERQQKIGDLAKAMKSGGDGLAIAQLSHAGRQTPFILNPTPFSASDVQLEVKRRGMGFGTPKALTLEEIQTEVIDRFVYAAKYCKNAGFDGIQLHSAHGYLLAQFLSPTTNKRTDKYGGSALNRVRLVLDIYEAIRKEIPAQTGFVIGLKFNSVEFQAHGLEVNDAAIMAEAIDKAGFDFIEISGGTIEKLAFVHLSDSTKAREAFFLDFCEKIKPFVKSTVIYLTGGFRTAEGMVNAVKSGSTAGIGLARPIAQEPDLPKKILQGLAESAVNSVFEGNFAAGNTAANSQMEQAGRTTMKEAHGDPCYGIMDLSTEEAAHQYKEALSRYAKKMEADAQSGHPIVGVLDFHVNGSKL